MRAIGFTCIVILLSYSLSSAQTERGRWQVGTQIGNLSYVNNGTRTAGSKQFSGSLLPSAGYFIAKNLVVGAGLPLSLSSSSVTDAYSVSKAYESKSTIIGIGIAPFLRYYLGEAKLKPFLGLSYSYVLNKANYQSYSGAKSSEGYTSVITPNLGLAYFITRNIALSATLGYNIQSQSSYFLVSSLNGVDTGPAITTKSLDFGIGFQLFFGK
ncbi:outer membrane beta-barrel protein [Spirosoma rigui]|uniref:outer membrane beta-barrel protein n=1 Tax=Spirosoma rigui TaxID=564064 RepID=UPI001472CD81|nr:outer membrane beta-barrel protein [Spirosoma rigui]